ncbi:MAG: hypothetical protein IJ225_03660 [Solobacterium sp.]|nr:hypothetical protein [Solobacterium sp.]
MSRSYRGYWIAGIIGALLFGIGDWLLGYVNPEVVDSAFSFIRAGHGASYPLSFLSITLFTGALGIPFLLAGCLGITELVMMEQERKRFRYLMALLPSGWMIIHFSITASVLGFSWMAHYQSVSGAVKLAGDILQLLQLSSIVSYLLVGIPLIALTVMIWKGKITLPKHSLWFTPLVWMILLSVMKLVLPLSKFSYGLDAFAMNGGMLVWFLYLLSSESSRSE